MSSICQDCGQWSDCEQEMARCLRILKEFVREHGKEYVTLVCRCDLCVQTRKVLTEWQARE